MKKRHNKEQRHNKEKKEIRYEDDLKAFVNLKNKNKPIYNKLMKKYYEFLNQINAEHNKVDYPNINSVFSFIKYFNNKKDDFEFIVKSFVDADIQFDFEEINSLVENFAHSQGVNLSLYKKVKSYEDIKRNIEELIKKGNIEALRVLIYVLDYVFNSYANRLTSIINFMEAAYDPFLNYYNLILNRENVSQELVDEIIELMAHSTFATINKNMTFGEDKDKNIKSFIDYKTGFINYTNKHNDNIKRVNVVKIETKPEKKEEKKNVYAIKNDVDLNEPVSIEKEVSAEDKMIQNYVDSYFEVIISPFAGKIEDNLPNSSISGYDKIMLALLKRYEEYLTELSEVLGCDLDEDDPIYVSLSNIVSSIKS